jgi:pSer/pThr/pTyr-binding forkhead associated (FHA) protein
MAAAFLTCRNCGASVPSLPAQAPCPQCGNCVACGSEPGQIVHAPDEAGRLERCSLCGRDNRGCAGAVGPVLRCVEPAQHRYLLLPLALEEDAERQVTLGRSDFMHWPERSSQTKALSRTHLRIRRKGKGYTIEDVSSNGTSLNGVELVRGGAHPVADGDKIGLVTTGSKPVLILEFVLPRERVRAAGASRQVAPAEVEPVTLPDGGVPARPRKAVPPAPPPPSAKSAPARPAGRSRQEDSEAPSDEGPQGAEAQDRFSLGLASLLDKAKKGKKPP